MGYAMTLPSPPPPKERARGATGIFGGSRFVVRAFMTIEALSAAGTIEFSFFIEIFRFSMSEVDATSLCRFHTTSLD